MALDLARNCGNDRHNVSQVPRRVTWWVELPELELPACGALFREKKWTKRALLDNNPGTGKLALFSITCSYKLNRGYCMAARGYEFLFEF